MMDDFQTFSAFRAWVHQRWIDNCEEHNLYDLPRHTIEDYWHANKWWLKYKYREETKKARLDEERQIRYGKINNSRPGDSFFHP